MPAIAPTIGRKVYYIPRGTAPAAKYDDQPLDATIIYVWPKLDPAAPFDLVNLFVIDHSGQVLVRAHVPLVQDGQMPPLEGHYVEWMPYQKGQAAKAEVIETQLALQQGGQTAVLPNVDPATTPGNGSSPDSSKEQRSPTTLEATPISTNGDSGSQEGFNYSSDFGGALSGLRAGKKVSRAGWNGKGMFVYLVPAASYPAQTGVAKAHFGENAMVPYNAYLAIKNVDGTISTWVPSVNDVLADDWSVE